MSNVMFSLVSLLFCLILLMSCWLAWPLLRRRRIYVAAAAVGCLTPMLLWVLYPSMGTSWEVDWPRVLGRMAILTAWLVPLVSCMLAWPLLRRRRIYVAAAAVGCLTPLFVWYPFVGLQILPLVLALPSYVIYFGPWQGIVYMALPVGLPIGVITWFLCKRFLPPPSVQGGGSPQGQPGD